MDVRDGKVDPGDAAIAGTTRGAVPRNASAKRIDVSGKVAEAKRLMALGDTMRAASAKVGISPSTVSKRMDVPCVRGRPPSMTVDDLRTARARLARCSFRSVADGMGVSESTVRRRVGARRGWTVERGEPENAD